MQDISDRNVYGWKPGACVKADAQTAGGVCYELVRTVGLTPHNLVEASREESAPLHPAFEWDDTLAAEKWREQQASHIIRSLTIRVDQSEPVRAYVSVIQSGEPYEPIRAVITAPDKRARLIEQALAELRAFQSKYATLNELCDLFAAIDAATARLSSD